MHFAFLLTLLWVAVAAVVASPSSGLDKIALDKIQQPIVVHQPEVFKEAIKIIGSLESAPSCHRLATRTLLQSCQSITVNKDSEPNVALDQVKSVFAARLAVCELNGAHAAIPTQCLAMLPKHSPADSGIRCFLPGNHCDRSKESSDKPNFSFEELSQRQIEQCLAALESRPQWWTSYSNARQNAVVMCHATRSEIDREQLLDMHRDMTKVSSDVSQEISKASQRSTEYLKAQADFAKRVHDLQASTMQDLTTVGVEVQSIFRAVASQVETTIADLTARFKKTSINAADDMEKLNSRIKKTTDEVATAQSIFQTSMDSLSSQQEALQTAQQHIAKHSQVSALALHNSLDAVRSQQIEPLEIALGDLHGLIHAQTELMQMMYAKQRDMDDRLHHFNETISDLQMQASMTGESLKSHAGIQVNLFEKLTSQMTETNGLASSLRDNLEGAHNSLATSVMGVLNPFKNVFPGRFGLAVAVSILAYLLHGAQATRRVVIFELVLYLLITLYEQAKSFWSFFSLKEMMMTTTMTSALLSQEPGLWSYLILVLGMLGGLAAWTVFKMRTRRAKRHVEHGNILSEAFSTRKRGHSISTTAPEYTM